MPNYAVIRCTTTCLRRKAREIIDTYHSYIKWADRPSRKLYWLLTIDNEPVGAFGLGSAFARPKAVKAFMNEHDIAFNEMANNIVYCLKPDLPKNSGTRFLAQARRDAVHWWYDRYSDTLKVFQCFVLPPRTGAVYKADNWECIGTTSGNSYKTESLYGDDPRKEKSDRYVSARTGEVKYLLRQPQQVQPKLIFMRHA